MKNMVMIGLGDESGNVVNFPNRIPDCDSHSYAFLDLSFLLTLVFAQQWLSLHLEMLIMLLSQILLIFLQIKSGFLFP